jgi:CubicO group peptidase (beta-lactamase class C family)
MVSQCKSSGFETIALSVYNQKTNPMYASLMIKRSTQTSQMHFSDLNLLYWVLTVHSLSYARYAPYIVSAIGPANDPLIATVFQPTTVSGEPFIKVGITRNELIGWNTDRRLKNFILQSVDAYGTPNDTRFIAIWYKNLNNVAWNCFFADTALEFLRIDQAMQSAGISPMQISITPTNGYVAVYVDYWEKVKAETKADLTSSRYQLFFDAYWKIGRMPTIVSATGSGTNAKFSAVFVYDEPSMSRQFRSSGPTTIQEIDQEMEFIMRTDNIRGAALAVVQDKCLVYCKGYTWAEPQYPDIQPTTFFRQASVTKTFTALATYQLIEDQMLKLDSNMQDILQLTTPDNKQPLDSEFGNITIRHLLEHSSGVPGHITGNDVQIANIFNRQLPVTRDDIARYCASLRLQDPMTGNTSYLPGTTKRYSNAGYFMLGRVVAKLRQSQSLIGAIEPTMLRPLQITRIRESASLIETFPNDEARYHMHSSEALSVNSNVMGSSDPIVAWVYGDGNIGNYEGGGGLSAAVPDVARLLAALSDFKNSPILEEQVLQDWFCNAIADKDSNGDQGHGFGSVEAITQAKNAYLADKGGWLGGSQNQIHLNTAPGGVSYVICMNGHTLTTRTDFSVLRGILEAEDWPEIDLFPNYGMPSTGPKCTKQNKKIKSKRRKVYIRKKRISPRGPPKRIPSHNQRSRR